MNHTTLNNLAFWIFEAFIQILLNGNLSLNQTLLTFLLSIRETWMTYWFGQFLCDRLSFFNSKGFYYSYVWSCSLCEGRASFCTVLIYRKLCGLLLMSLTEVKLLHSVPYFFFLYWSLSMSLCMVFMAILCYIVRFSWSSYLLMCLSLETLVSIIRTG